MERHQKKSVREGKKSLKSAGAGEGKFCPLKVVSPGAVFICAPALGAPRSRGRSQWRGRGGRGSSPRSAPAASSCAASLPPCLPPSLLRALLASLPASFPPARPPSALGPAGCAPSPKRVTLAKSAEQPQRRQLRCFCISKAKVSRCLLPLTGLKKKPQNIYTATDRFERKRSYSSQITLPNSCTCFQHSRCFILVFQSLLRTWKACCRASSGACSIS